MARAAEAVEEQDGIEVIDHIEPIEPDPAAGTPAAAPKLTPEQIELKRVQGELKRTNARLRESDTTAKYWMEQGRRTPAVVAATPAVDPDADLDNIDIVNELTEHGIKGLVAHLDKRYSKPQDVAAALGATRRSITTDAKLLKDYPDLEDHESEFFQATSKIYNSLIADDPHMAASPKLIQTAARLAKAEMGTIPIDRGGKRRVAAPGDEEEDDFSDEAETREERVGRQSGDRGRGKARSDEVEELSALQKSIVRKFRAAGADSLTDESYRKRAQSGVRLGGRAPQAAALRRAA